MARSVNDGQRHETNVLAGVVAGLVGGLVGTWAMSEFQALWSKAADGHEPPSAGGRHDARDWQERNEDQNANELAAQAVAKTTIDRPLTREELEVAAPAVHYAFGATMGAVYGGLAEVSPAVRLLGGSGWGTAVWIGGDEIAVPLLGLSRPDTDYPIEAHAQALAAHLVYGVTTELVRRGVRALM
jgi:putative membrane protein